MTLQECLALLDDNLRFIDLSSTGRTIRTVAELKQLNKHDTLNIYEVRVRSKAYGREESLSIGVVGGFNLFNGVDRFKKGEVEKCYNLA